MSRSRHLIVTRFAVPRPEGGTAETYLDPEWLEARLELFRRFYFGCEADDRMNATAFNTTVNAFGERLNAIFSSDIGHFDVPDMTRVVAEAYELVSDGAMSARDFRDFAADNTIRLHGQMNPSFWEGTPVADYARGVLQAQPKPA